MITTGSRLFLGLAATALTGFLLYGFLQEWGALGVIGLAVATVVLLFLGGITLYTRDSDVARTDAAAIAASGAAQPRPARSVAPLLGALGAGLLVFGLVTDRRWFVAGIVFVGIALVDWTVQAWAARASGDNTYNTDIRDRTLLPLQLPILGALGLGVLIFSFSRVMLTTSSDLGPVLFVVAAGVILIFGFIFAARRKPGRNVVASICVVGALGMVIPGVWAANNGEREELAHEADEFYEERTECGEELNPTDKDAANRVGAKSSVAAEVILRDGLLVAVQSGRDTETVYLQKSNPASILFKNEDGGDEPRRLNAVYLVNDNGTLSEKIVCTNAIGEGDQAFMTVNIPLPNAYAPEGREFMFVVPGLEGAEIGIEVP